MKIVKFKAFLICKPRVLKTIPSWYKGDCAKDLGLRGCRHCSLKRFCVEVRTQCSYPKGEVIF